MTTSTKSTCDAPGRPGHVGNFWWQFVGTPSVDSCTKAEWLQEDSQKRKTPIVALEQKSRHLVNRFKFLDDFSRFKLYIRFIQVNNSANQNRSMSELSAHLHWCERTNMLKANIFQYFEFPDLNSIHTHTSKRNIPTRIGEILLPHRNHLWSHRLFCRPHAWNVHHHTRTPKHSMRSSYFWHCKSAFGVARSEASPNNHKTTTPQ